MYNFPKFGIPIKREHEQKMSLNHDTTKQFDEDKEFRKVYFKLLKKRPPSYIFRKHPFYTNLCRIVLIAYFVCVIDFIIFNYAMDEHLLLLSLKIIFPGFVMLGSLFLCIRTTQWILHVLHNKAEEESFEESYGKWSICRHMGIFLISGIMATIMVGGSFFTPDFFTSDSFHYLGTWRWGVYSFVGIAILVTLAFSIFFFFLFFHCTTRRFYGPIMDQPVRLGLLTVYMYFIFLGGIIFPIIVVLTKEWL